MDDNKTTTTKRSIRMTFSEYELVEIYGLLGGKIGYLRDQAALADKRPSEIAMEIATYQMTQDRIETAIRREREEQAKETAK